MFFLSALLLGFVSGLRTLTAPAAVSWAAHLGLLKLAGTPLAFMGSKYTAIIFTVLAVGELINDKFPKTPSRKTPPQFIARLVSGALVGACVGEATGALAWGVLAGVVGAVAGTLGGAWQRGRLASSFGRDLPAALLEDALAIVVAVLVVARF